MIALRSISATATRLNCRRVNSNALVVIPSCPALCRASTFFFA
jgi:hypothetical protein